MGFAFRFVCTATAEVFFDGGASPAASWEAYSIFIESFFSVGISEPNLNHVQRAGLSAKGFRRQRQRHSLSRLWS
jgi:hypothetical protein